MSRELWAVLGMLLTLGCAGPRYANMCPEYHDMLCISTPVCVSDRSRSCMVCRCNSPGDHLSPDVRTTALGRPELPSTNPFSPNQPH